MQTYQCHKRVKAAPIISCDVVDNLVTYRAADGSEQGIRVHGDFFGRGIPPIDAYLVEYEGGYLSWSPADAFMDGYTLVVPGKTLADYLQGAGETGTIDFRVRANVTGGGPVSFYIHPQGRDGETQDFVVRGNVLAAK